MMTTTAMHTTVKRTLLYRNRWPVESFPLLLCSSHGTGVQIGNVPTLSRACRCQRRVCQGGTTLSSQPSSCNLGVHTAAEPHRFTGALPQASNPSIFCDRKLPMVHHGHEPTLFCVVLTLAHTLRCTGFSLGHPDT